MNLLDKNLDFFSKYDKGLYDRLVLLGHEEVQDYQIHLSGQGCPDIVQVSTGDFIYKLQTIGDLLEDARLAVNGMKPCFSPPPSLSDESSESYRYTSPIHSEFHDNLVNAGPSGRRKEYLVNNPGGYVPFVRLYGVGLGYHLIDLIETRQVDYLVIYEPSLSLFWCSLHTVPWWLVVEYFAKRKGDVLVSVGVSPEEFALNEKYWLTNRFRFLAAAFFRLARFDCHEIREAMSLEKKYDGVMILERNLGWYEDQRAGYYHSIRNFLSFHPVYNGKGIAPPSRCFVVGSGPTLNESIQYIKDHQGDAVIFTCGSALFSLLDAGIEPDYQIIQERFWVDFEEKLAPDVLKRLKLIMLNAVYDKVAEYYGETFLALKANEPGSSLWPEEYPVMYWTHPTVTNMGLTLAASMGFSEVWMFGCDYGKHEKYAKPHADGGYYGVLKDENAYVDELAEDVKHPGALGGTVLSDHHLSMSRQAAESLILLNQKTSWIRVGDGAEIKGVTAVSSVDLGELNVIPIQKTDILAQIRRCFSSEYAGSIDLSNLPEWLEKDFSAYLLEMSRIFRFEFQTRSEIVRNLRFLAQGADQACHEHHLSGQLLAGSLMLFVAHVYVQVALCETDEEAAGFYAAAREYLVDFMNSCAADAIKTTEGALSGDLSAIPFMSALKTRVG